MYVIRRKGWEIPEREATPEALFFDRRTIVRAGAIAAGAAMVARGSAAYADDADPSAGLYPAKRNEAYTLDRPVTPAKASMRITIISTSTVRARISTRPRNR